MPSIFSRKPCTKCCRACSPSPTMSMPASSWIFTASNVASRLPSIRSLPSRRHGAHRRSGSASQAGFGKLPAMVVSNNMMMIPARGLKRARTLHAPPVIKPVVTLAQFRSAHPRESRIPQVGEWAAQMIDAAGHAGGALDAGRAPPPQTLIEPQAPAPARRHAAARHWASVTASSIAIAAPCAMKGSAGCAASPSNVIAPCPSAAARRGHRATSLPGIGIVDEVARRGDPMPRAEALQNVVAPAGRAPVVAALDLSSTMATTLILRPAETG